MRPATLVSDEVIRASSTTDSPVSSPGQPLSIDQLLADDNKISSAPQVACKLNRLLKDSPFLSEVVDVIQYDPALTSRILQVCNTPYYRGKTQIVSLQDAVSRLGNNVIRRLVWQVAASNQLAAGAPAYRLTGADIWRHSVLTAIAAEEIFRLCDLPEDISAAFTAGLLHDIGKILVNRALAPYAGKIRDYVQVQGMEPYRAETALLGYNHMEMGARLLDKWGQGEPLISGVLHHHEPFEAENKPFATLIYAANICSHHQEQMLQKQTKAACPHIGQESLDLLKLDAAGLEKALRATRQRREEVEILMSIL